MAYYTFLKGAKLWALWNERRQNDEPVRERVAA